MANICVFKRLVRVLSSLLPLLFLLLSDCSPNNKKASPKLKSESSSSGFIIPLDSPEIRRLANLGMIWGFLKYYHPAVALGQYNWDEELFRILPKVIEVPNNIIAYRILEKWVDRLGDVPICHDCHLTKNTIQVKQQADFGYLFLNNNLTPSLRRKLVAIQTNYKPTNSNYYVDFTDNVQNPIFKNEVDYKEQIYPNAPLRLLALYRYWNMIQYFYPYKYLIREDWNVILEKFIPRFIQARDKSEYALTCLELIGKIHDTHANIWGKNSVLDSLKGTMITPFQAKFIENKLVVTGFYIDSNIFKKQIGIGDIIEKINGVPVDTLVEKYLPYSPASNYETQLRVLTSSDGFLLRSNDNKISLTIKRGLSSKNILTDRIPLSAAYKEMDWTWRSSRSSYKLLQDNIGYIYPAKLQDRSIDTIKKVLGSTKGIVIDMRCYPSTFMPFVFATWLKNRSAPFVRFSVANIFEPGSFVYTAPLSNGGNNSQSYKGKIVILVNEQTQSLAEYTTMALCCVQNVKVIGSTTAGADGDVSEIILPGGISTMISGIGVYYPNGTETQRIGVKIDIPMRPTISGIRTGKDELLNKAIDLLKY